MSGASTAPDWVSKIEYCKEMDLKPWDHFGGSKLLWWYRWKALRNEVNRVNKAKDNG